MLTEFVITNVVVILLLIVWCYILNRRLDTAEKYINILVDDVLRRGDQ